MPSLSIKACFENKESILKMNKNVESTGSVTAITPTHIDWIQGKVWEWDTPQLATNNNPKYISKFLTDRLSNKEYRKMELDNIKSVSWTETTESRVISLRAPNVPSALKKAFNDSEITPIKENKLSKLDSGVQSYNENFATSLSIEDLVNDMKATNFKPKINKEPVKIINKASHILQRSKSSLVHEPSPISKFLTPDEISKNIK